MNPLLTKTYDAGAVVNPCRIVKFGSADYTVIQATDGSASLIGVSDQVGIETSGSTASGARLDVHKEGLANVMYGDTVTRGAWLTADADGKAVPATLTPGTTVHVIGQAEVAGVAGDVAPIRVQPTVIANDTGIVSVDVTISTSELLALNATPKQLIAAPGAGKAIILVDYQAFYDYNSAAYAGIAAGEDVALRYTDGSGTIVAQIEATGFLDATADEYRQGYPLADAAKEPVANAALVAHMLTGEIITGNSPLKLRLRYRTVDLTW